MWCYGLDMGVSRANPRWMILCLSCAALLNGCGGNRGPVSIPPPPESLSGVWQRVGLESPPIEQSPEALLPLKPTHRLRTSYQRIAGAILVEAFAMPSSTSAFEAEQKWKKEPASVSFHHGSFFVVCSSSTEPVGALVDFSRILETAWFGEHR